MSSHTVNHKTWIPSEGSVADNVLQFLRENNGQSFTPMWIACETSCNHQAVKSALRDLVKAGYVQRVFKAQYRVI